MTNTSPFGLPPVTEDDCDWACTVMKLPKAAFRGPDGKDPRQEILMSNETLDIEACPGSGKTTLAVAKLAILARKWPSHRRGICVLSHTNVARKQIEERLGGLAEGRRLLTYPHFVGTIHGFVNGYLALPWLRSRGYRVTLIDNYRCEQHRRRLLSLPQFKALDKYVNLQEASGKVNIVSKWRVASPTFDVIKENGDPEFRDANVKSAKQLMALTKNCVNDGYYRYDEMFVWAQDLVDQIPEVRNAIRERFPVLFLDEVQDNSELQSAFLYKLFSDGDSPVMRQRFGDSNQGIYHSVSQDDGATTDRFPHAAIRIDIPNSHRFGREIGHLANALALDPQKLLGCGPCHDKISCVEKAGKHAIFLFEDHAVTHVLTAYARYLLEAFSEQELRSGVFTAVGGVHRPGDDDKLPRFVGHYWPDYDHELVIEEPSPSTFQQYVEAGRSRTHGARESVHVVEKFASGILHLVRILDQNLHLSNRRRKHRYVLELLAEKPYSRTAYLNLLVALAGGKAFANAEEWRSKWVDAIGNIAEGICGISAVSQEARAFLEWRSDDQCNLPPLATRPLRRRDNFFRYPDSNPKVQIRVGSIHSVKGQTHTATLVLDTFYRKHHLATLKPWLLGEKSGKGSEGVQNQSRLKLHYVAMTRPSHLLCLAMREDACTPPEVTQLKDKGWRVARVAESSVIWL